MSDDITLLLQEHLRELTDVTEVEKIPLLSELEPVSNLGVAD